MKRVLKKSNLKKLIKRIIKETVNQNFPSRSDLDAGEMKTCNLGENDDERKCDCGSGLPSEWAYDAQGIELDRVCPKCKQKKLGKYRPEILSGYTQADVDEPIEPEEYEESVAPDGRYVDDMESGAAVKKLHNLDEAPVDGQTEPAQQPAEQPKTGKYRISFKKGNDTNQDVGDDLRAILLKARQGDVDEFSVYRNVPGLNTANQLQFLVAWYDKNNSGGFAKLAGRNEQVAMKRIKSLGRLHEAFEKTGGGPYPEVTIQQDAMGNLHIWKGKVQPIRTGKYGWEANGKEADVFIQSKDDIQLSLSDLPGEEREQIEQGHFVTTKYFPDQYFSMSEMTGTGAVAGYQTPFAFSKKKSGSQRALDVTKKMGFKVVKGIDEQEQIIKEGRPKKYEKH
jgi:hypothetical protein